MSSAIVSGLAAGQWTTNVSNIYNNNAGNVGIGTTSPTAKLSIEGAHNSTYGQLLLRSSIEPRISFQTDSGGAAYGRGAISLSQVANKWGMNFELAGTPYLTISGYPTAGNVGIGTAVPSWRLTVVGPASDWAQVVNWPPGSVNGYGILVGTGAGKYSQFQNAEGYYSMLVNSSWGMYSNGNVGAAGFYYVSDKGLKENVRPLSQGLVALMKLNPVSFTWKVEAGLGRAGNQDIGLIAQEVQKVVPEAVHTDTTSGYLSIDYPRLLPLLINSIKELASGVSETAHLVIDMLTAHTGNFGRVNTEELCVDDVCVTREQFAQVFGNQSAAAARPRTKSVEHGS